MEKDRQSRQKALEQLKEDLVAKERDAASWTRSYKELQESHQKVLEGDKRRIQKLEVELTSLRDSQKNLQESLAKAKEGGNELKASRDRHREESDLLAKDLQKAIFENEMLKQQHASLCEEAAKKSEEIKILHEDREKGVHDLSVATKATEELKRQLGRTEAEMKVKSESINILEKDASGLRSAVADLQESFEKSQASVTSLQMDQTFSSQQNKKLLEDLQKQKQQAEGDANRFRAAQKASEESMRQLRENLKMTQAGHKQAQKELDIHLKGSDAKIQALQEQISTAKLNAQKTNEIHEEEKNLLTRKHDEARREVENLQNTKKNLETNLEKTKEALAHTSSKLIVAGDQHKAQSGELDKAEQARQKEKSAHSKTLSKLETAEKVVESFKRGQAAIQGDHEAMQKECSTLKDAHAELQKKLSSSIEGLQRELSERDSELNNARLVSTSGQTMVDKLKAQLNSAQQRYAALEKESSKTIQEGGHALQKARDELAEARKQATDSTISSSELTKKSANLESQLQKAVDERIKAEISHRKSQESVTRLEGETATAASTISKLEEDIGSTTEELKKAQETITRLTSELKSLREDGQTLRSKVYDLEKQSAEAFESLTHSDAKHKQSTQKVGDLESQLSDLRQERDRNVEKNDELLKTVEELNARLKQAMDKELALDIELSRIREREALARSEIEKLTVAGVDSAAQLTKLRQTIEDHESSAEELRLELKKVNSESTTVSQFRESEHKELQETQQKAQASALLVEKFKADARSSEVKIDNLERQTKEREAEVDKLQARAREATGDLEQLTRQHSEATVVASEAEDKAQETLKQANRRLSSVEAELEASKKTAAATGSELRVARGKLELQKKKASNADTELNKVKAEVAALQESGSKVTAKCDALQKELDAAKEASSGKATNVGNVSRQLDKVQDGLKSSQCDVQRKETDLQAAQVAHESTKTKLAIILAKSSERAKELEAARTKLATASQDPCSQQTALQEVREAHDSARDQAQVCIDKLQAQIETFSHGREAAETDVQHHLSVVQQESSTQATEMKTVRVAAKAAEAAAEKHHAEMFSMRDSLEEKVHQQAFQVEELEPQLQHLRLASDEQEKAAHSAQQSLAYAEKSAKSARQELDAAQSTSELELSQLRSQVRKLEASLFEENEKAQKAMKKAAEMEKELKGLGTSPGGMLQAPISVPPRDSLKVQGSHRSAPLGSRAHRRSATTAHIPSLSPLAENDTGGTHFPFASSEETGPVTTAAAATFSKADQVRRKEDLIPKAQRHRRRESLQLLGKRIAADVASANGSAALQSSESESKQSIPMVQAISPEGHTTRPHAHGRKQSNPLDSEDILAADSKDASLRNASRVHVRTPQLVDIAAGLLFCAHCMGEELLVV